MIDLLLLIAFGIIIILFGGACYIAGRLVKALNEYEKINLEKENEE